MASRPILIVDEHDVPIGSATKEEAWKRGLHHRIVIVHVIDGAGNMLLQKRGPAVEIFPNRWDHGAAGHVDAGETYFQAAQRELKEELGIVGVPLKEVGDFRTNRVIDDKILHRFHKLYRAVISQDMPLHLQLSEVADARWFSLSDIRVMLHDTPELVTLGLIEVFEKFYPEPT